MEVRGIPSQKLRRKILSCSNLDRINFCVIAAFGRRCRSCRPRQRSLMYFVFSRLWPCLLFPLGCRQFVHPVAPNPVGPCSCSAWLQARRFLRHVGSLARPEKQPDGNRASFARCAAKAPYPVQHNRGTQRMRGRRAPRINSPNYITDRFYELKSLQLRAASPPRRTLPEFVTPTLRRHIPCAPRTPQTGQPVG